MTTHRPVAELRETTMDAPLRPRSVDSRISSEYPPTRLAAEAVWR
ncbi:hypothetical protein FHT17_001005 [Novosphingobium sp. SG916]|nr:hypothetical protein [Novosphingobium sp. SG919]NMN86135.1 hypothetical protein [Novosphingobium sp. SG916]